MSKQRVLIIAPPNSYRLAPYIRAAKKLGVELQVASDGEHSLTAEVAFGLHINLNNQSSALDTIVKAAQKHPYSCIIATDDYTVELAALIANALHLPHNPPQAAQLARRKDLARSTLQQADIQIPKFTIIDLRRNLLEQIHGFCFPCVLKPLALSASRGVIRVDGDDSYLDACARIGKIIASSHDDYERNHILAEQYVAGNEVAVEAILRDGKYQAITIFDKPEPLEGPFFEESYYITPTLLSNHQQQQIHNTVASACKAYGLVTGPVHAELRIADDNIWLIEVAARTIGGECAQLLEYATGQSLEEMVITNAMGNILDMQAFNQSVGVLMIPTPKSGILRRIEGLLEAGKVEYIEAINIAIREGHELVQLPEGASYLGFIFARAPSNKSVEAALRTAHANLNIVVNPLWKIGQQAL